MRMMLNTANLVKTELIRIGMKKTESLSPRKTRLFKNNLRLVFISDGVNYRNLYFLPKKYSKQSQTLTTV